MISITKKPPARMLHVSEFAACRDPNYSLQPQAAAVGIKFNIQYESTRGHAQQMFHSSFKEIHMYFRQANRWVLMDFCVAVHGTCDIAKEMKRYNMNNLTVSSRD